MTNNDILHRIITLLDFDVPKILIVFALSDQDATLLQIENWLRKPEDSLQDQLSDVSLAAFLNGLIIERRGKKEGEQSTTELTLTRNNIFMKLKIALDLKADDVMGMLELAGTPLSKHELSGLFRKPGHKHYRECSVQVLNNFLNGLKLKYR
ncbi:MAG: DUF1456 family protein [Pseudomonadota bacterium]